MNEHSLQDGSYQPSTKRRKKGDDATPQQTQQVENCDKTTNSLQYCKTCRTNKPLCEFGNGIYNIPGGNKTCEPCRTKAIANNSKKQPNLIVNTEYPTFKPCDGKHCDGKMAQLLLFIRERRGAVGHMHLHDICNLCSALERCRKNKARENPRQEKAFRNAFKCLQKTIALLNSSLLRKKELMDFDYEIGEKLS